MLNATTLLPPAAAPLASALVALDAAVARVREAAESASLSDRVDALSDVLGSSDSLVSLGIDLLGQGHGVAAVSGMPQEMTLQLDARRTGGDAAMLVKASRVLASMPSLDGLFRAGVVSWPQTRLICSALARVASRDRAGIDSLIAREAPRLREADPDRLVELVDDAVRTLRFDALVKREEHAPDRSFLWIQSRLDGGASLYGQADPQAAATICEALDVIAERPYQDPEDPERRVRSEQRFEALLQLCENSLSGASALRPRPRLYATVDIATTDRANAMHLLTGLVGRRPRMTRVAADELCCDAKIVPIIMRNGRPVEVADETSIFSEKTRRAIIARDQGCRTPACNAPSQWCDIHHIIPGVGNTPDDGILQCRQCHRRTHRHNIKITWDIDGSLVYTHPTPRRRRYRSPPP